jgi:hypothetical protein
MNQHHAYEVEVVGINNINWINLISPVIKACNNTSSSIMAWFTHARIKWFYFTESTRVTLKTLAAVTGNAINTRGIVKTRKCSAFINILLT